MASAPIRIALADDHAVVRSGYRRLLELEDGFSVIAEFADGDAALRWFGNDSADVLVLDLSMPGRDGMDTLRRLRRIDANLAIVIFTMHESAELATQALKLGARGYLTKSSRPETLIDAIRRVARGDVVLSPDIASAARQHASATSLPHEQLSPRELDVFLLLAEGQAVERIAGRRHLSLKTVANYQTSIRQKTGLGNAVEMYRYALVHGMLQPPTALMALN